MCTIFLGVSKAGRELKPPLSRDTPEHGLHHTTTNEKYICGGRVTALFVSDEVTPPDCSSKAVNMENYQSFLHKSRVLLPLIDNVVACHISTCQEPVHSLPLSFSAIELIFGFSDPQTLRNF